MRQGGGPPASGRSAWDRGRCRGLPARAGCRCPGRGPARVPVVRSRVQGTWSWQTGPCPGTVVRAPERATTFCRTSRTANRAHQQERRRAPTRTTTVTTGRATLCRPPRRWSPRERARAGAWSPAHPASGRSGPHRDRSSLPLDLPFVTSTDGVSLHLGDLRSDVRHVGTAAHTTAPPRDREREPEVPDRVRHEHRHAVAGPHACPPQRGPMRNARQGRPAPGLPLSPGRRGTPLLFTGKLWPRPWYGLRDG